MEQETTHPLYRQGIENFNRGEYFESHESWEELWIQEAGDDRQFYKGLIQAAVALYHLANGNVVGARKLVNSSAAYLDAYRPHHRGLNVDDFLDAVRLCFDRNVETRSAAPGDLELRPAIRLQPPSDT